MRWRLGRVIGDRVQRLHHVRARGVDRRGERAWNEDGVEPGEIPLLERVEAAGTHRAAWSYLVDPIHSRHQMRGACLLDYAFRVVPEFGIAESIRRHRRRRRRLAI